MSENVTFTAKQLAAIEWFAASNSDRHPPTQLMLAKELGVTERTIIRWKELPGFRDAATARARELLGDSLPQIYAALRREATKGSFQHIKLAMEMSGEHVDKTESLEKVELQFDFSNLSDEQLNKLLETAHSLKGT